MKKKYGRCKITKEALVNTFWWDRRSLMLKALKDRGAPIKGIVFLRKNNKYDWNQRNCEDGSIYFKWARK